MVIYKSLIVSFALILALIGAGILAVSAHTLASAQQQHNVLPYQNGIAAISVAADQHKRVSFQDVRLYLKSKGFVGGPTLTGAAPLLKDLRLIRISHLDSTVHSLLPHLPGNKLVYYAQLKGPFTILPQMSLPVLATLVPSSTNRPALIPHLSNLSSLGLISPLLGLLPHTQPGPPGSHKAASSSSGILKMPDLSNLQSSNSNAKPRPSDLHANPRLVQIQSSNTQTNALAGSFQNNNAQMSQKKANTIIATAYEVFDPDNGNLLAWG